jgi:hypothetical protein
VQRELGVTSIVVEHRVPCVRTVADEVMFLEKGRAVLQAPPEEFFHSDNERIVRFLGEESGAFRGGASTAGGADDDAGNDDAGNDNAREGDGGSGGPRPPSAPGAGGARSTSKRGAGEPRPTDPPADESRSDDPRPGRPRRAGD